MIIDAHTAPTMLSSISGGALTQPRRIPGNRLFDRLVTYAVRCGISAASGAFSGDTKPYTSSSMTVRRYFSAMAAICRRLRSDMIAEVGFCSRGMQYNARARVDRQAVSSASGRRPSASIATARIFRCCWCASARAPEYVNSSISSVSFGLSSADMVTASPCWAPAVSTR